MAELDMSVLISREYLGLVPLEVNDRVRYKVGKQFLGAAVDYNRTTASSAYIDGEVTTHRTKQMVTDPCEFEVFGRALPTDGLMTAEKLMLNHRALIAAVSQNDYTLTVEIDGQRWKYSCEASGYTATWDGPRFVAREGKVTVQLRRHPTAIEGY